MKKVKTFEAFLLECGKGEKVKSELVDGAGRPRYVKNGKCLKCGKGKKCKCGEEKEDKE